MHRIAQATMVALCSLDWKILYRLPSLLLSMKIIQTTSEGRVETREGVDLALLYLQELGDKLPCGGNIN